MQLALIVAISVHILAATFWAGSTFALARMAGTGSEELYLPQLTAAFFAIGAGGYLWHTLHEGSFGITEQLLRIGAVAAILALAIQAAIVGSALRRCAKPTATPRVFGLASPSASAPQPFCSRSRR